MMASPVAFFHEDSRFTMTARHQLRLGKRLGRDRSAIDATAAPPVGEMLQLARERKGVDLYRAERDTKIRLRYLAALEDGDWSELPAPVYTKGFLRNYAIYLGLEPDEILDRWRDEMEQLRTATRVAVAPPPMPLVEPGGRRLTLSPQMVVGALLVVVIVAFVGYLGVQFMRFVDVTEIGLTYPPNVVSVIDAEQVTLRGTAGRGALISITGPDGQLYNTTTDQTGTWSRDVPLTRGRNNFTIVATDPVTQRESKTVELAITVPLPSSSPGATATVVPPPPITMTLFGPTDGYTTTDPNVIVSGTTTGTRITVASTYVGAPPATAPPLPTPVPSGLALPSARPARTPTRSAPPSASGIPSPAAPPAGPTADITVPSGSFTQSLTFPVGTWRLTITSGATGLAPVSQSLQIVVQPPAVPIIHLSILVAGKQTTLKVNADGVTVPELDGITVTDGQTYTATASSEFCVRSTNANKLSLTLDGTPLGLLSGQAGSWIIKPGQPPEPAPSPC
jgi:cytoskeletal protein RodZ